MIRLPAPPLDVQDVLRRVVGGARPFLLDGATDADGLGRVSYAGADPDHAVTWSLGDRADPLALLDELAAAQAPWSLSVGYASYDLGRVFAPGGDGLRTADDCGLPALDFARYPAVWRHDARTGRAHVLARDEAAATRLLTLLRATPLPLAPARVGPMRWEIGDDVYRARVAKVLAYLQAGDVYQVNLSHRLRGPCDETGAAELYLRLRAIAPAPLGALLVTSNATLVSNSPELFLAASRRRIETRPIKGTRPRGRTPAEDAELAAELESSEKDRAEHLMIVDLERNDLGRLSQIGSVVVDGFARRVALPTVHHLVSTITARPLAHTTLGGLFRATFPGGSITGAPKRRAMEIIDELERVQRGPYCGAIGFVAPGMRARFSLAIRTAVVQRGELSLSVGGGIVADSTPDGELDETRVKAAAFLRAVDRS